MAIGGRLSRARSTFLNVHIIKTNFLILIQNYTLPNATWFLYNTANGGGIDVTVSTTPTLIRSWSASTISTER